LSRKGLSRRKFLAGSAAAGATILLTGALSAATKEENTMKKTFTILHTNDMHSSLSGMDPAADYTPFTLNDDATRGGGRRCPGDQGMAGDHGPPAQAAGQERGRTAHYPGR